MIIVNKPKHKNKQLTVLCQKKKMSPVPPQYILASVLFVYKTNSYIAQTRSANQILAYI